MKIFSRAPVIWYSNFLWFISISSSMKMQGECKQMVRQLSVLGFHASLMFKLTCLNFHRVFLEVSVKIHIRQMSQLFSFISTEQAISISQLICAKQLLPSQTTSNCMREISWINSYFKADSSLFVNVTRYLCLTQQIKISRTFFCWFWILSFLCTVF